MVRAHVLGVALFIAFWVVLAICVFFLAIRRGPGGARATIHAPSRAGRRALGLIIAVVYLGFGIAIPLAFLTGNHANANAQIGGIRLTAAEKRGRELFGLHCGVCHTLAGANAVGKVGPNLDTIRPAEQLVLKTINNGCLQSPASSSSPQNCLGQGNMPAGILQGQDAQDVAAFVSKVAGNE